jgi:hypothetical protein
VIAGVLVGVGAGVGATGGGVTGPPPDESPLPGGAWIGDCVGDWPGPPPFAPATPVAGAGVVGSGGAAEQAEVPMAPEDTRSRKRGIG